MKKITFIISFFITILGFSQNLVTNGDFQTGVLGDWYGSAANVVDLGGGNFVNQAEVTVPGDAFAANLSQNIALEDGKKYELTFDAFTDSTTGSRSMIVGLGQNGSPWSALTATTNMTDTPQTFTYEFIINYGDTVGDRVLFDMGAETGFVFIDNVSVVEVENTCANGVQDGDETGVDCGGSCPPCVTVTTPAPTPPNRAAADVVSIFSDAYSNAPTDGVPVFAGATLETVSVDSNPTLRLITPTPGGGFQYQYFGNPALDLTDFTHAHIDFYIEGSVATGQVLQVILQQFDASNNFQHNIIYSFDVNASGSGVWVSGDVEIASFSNGNLARDGIKQVQVVGAGPSAFGPIYIDNIYFHKNTTLSSDEFELSEVNVYPNPTNNIWNIKTNNSTINSIQVFDLLGKQVLNLSPDNSEAMIDASGLNNGIYFAKVSTDLGTKSIKLIKN